MRSPSSSGSRASRFATRSSAWPGTDLAAVARRLPLPRAETATSVGSVGPDEWACLAAVELYHNRLLTDMRALAYVERRGLEEERH